MTKPLIFISHVHEDAAYAEILHRELDEALLGGAVFFNTSDRASVRPGDPWRDRIMEALREAAVVLVVASSRSVPSPWVNFESGGGWLAGARVIPCCVAGMVPSSLPAPLGHLQAADLTRAEGVAEVFAAVADAAGLRVPPRLAAVDIAQAVVDASTGMTPDAEGFVSWIRRSALRPGTERGSSGSGQVVVGGHIGGTDAVAARTFPSQIAKGDTVECWVEVPGYGTLYHCYASGEIADELVSLATDRGRASKRRAVVTLLCLGVLEVFATDVSWSDEGQGVSYQPAYSISRLRLTAEATD